MPAFRSCWRFPPRILPVPRRADLWVDEQLPAFRGCKHVGRYELQNLRVMPPRTHVQELLWHKPLLVRLVRVQLNVVGDPLDRLVRPQVNVEGDPLVRLVRVLLREESRTRCCNSLSGNCYASPG